LVVGVLLTALHALESASSEASSQLRAKLPNSKLPMRRELLINY
jgi:hypothetical protein